MANLMDEYNPAIAIWCQIAISSLFRFWDQPLSKSHIMARDNV